MTEISVVQTEVMSYLLTKAEYCSDDVLFKVNNLEFMGWSSRTLGRVFGILNKDGLIIKQTRKHTPSLWRTNFMDGENLDKK